MAKQRAKSESAGQLVRRTNSGFFQRLPQARMGNHEGRGKPLRLAVDPVRLEAFGFEDGAHPIIQQGHFYGTLE